MNGKTILYTAAFGAAIVALIVLRAAFSPPSACPRDTGDGSAKSVVAHIVCDAGADPVVTESASGIYVIYNIDPWAVTTTLTKWNFESQVRQIVPALFAKFPDAAKVDIVATATFEDIRGNSDNVYALHTVFTRANAATIHWDLIDTDNIPRLADSYWQRPALDR